MAYTPELSMKSSCTLRRLAWALDMPMTKAMEKVFEYLPEILDREKFVRSAGIKRNVQNVSSISKPEFTRKMNEGLITKHFF